AGVGGEELPACWVGLELLQRLLAVLARQPAVEHRVADPEPLEHLGRLEHHRLPLAEDDALVGRFRRAGTVRCRWAHPGLTPGARLLTEQLRGPFGELVE